MGSDQSPLDVSTPWRRLLARLHTLIVDHGVLREVFWPNVHRLSERAFRSAQPSPSLIRRLHRKHGLRTIINLRGENPGMSWYALERRTCDELGITMVDFVLHSRDMPKPQQIEQARELLQRIEYPVLFHCKSGADRAGLMSTLYLYMAEGVPLDKTEQLKFMPYLHVKYSKTGMLDHFIETYLADTAAAPVDLLTWVRTRYDREGLKAAFHTSRSMDFIVDKILRRE